MRTGDGPVTLVWQMGIGASSKAAELSVALTGGAGLVGSRLAAALLSLGVSRVAILDSFVRGVEQNLAPVLSDERVELLKGDLRDASLRRRLLAGADVLFHLAALRITRCAREPAECVDSMIAGTFSLFDDACAAGVRRIVFASSHAVYGPPLSVPVTEHHPLRPTTFYGTAKLAGEGLLANLASTRGIEPVVLRFFNVYGPGMGRMGPDAEVLVRWMDALSHGEPPIVHAAGAGSLDLVHVDDVVQALVRSLGPQAPGEPINVGSGSEVALAELAQTMVRVAGAPVAPRFMPPPVDAPPVRYRADITRARERLGFEPSVPLRDGLEQLWSWYRALEVQAA